MIKISPLIGNLFAVRRFLTYNIQEDKKNMDDFAPSERVSTVNDNNVFGNPINGSDNLTYRASINESAPPNDFTNMMMNAPEMDPNMYETD